jgi:hypothetical protein
VHLLPCDWWWPYGFDMGIRDAGCSCVIGLFDLVRAISPTDMGTVRVPVTQDELSVILVLIFLLFYARRRLRFQIRINLQCWWRKE